MLLTVNFCEKLNRGSIIFVRESIKSYEGIPEMIVYSTNQMKFLGSVDNDSDW